MIVFPSHAPCLLQRDGDRTAEIDDRLGAHTGAQTAHTLAYAGSRGHSETLPLLNSRRSGAGHVGWKIGMACKGSGVRVPSAPLLYPQVKGLVPFLELISALTGAPYGAPSTTAI